MWDSTTKHTFSCCSYGLWNNALLLLLLLLPPTIIEHQTPKPNCSQVPDQDRKCNNRSQGNWDKSCCCSPWLSGMSLCTRLTRCGQKVEQLLSEVVVGQEGSCLPEDLEPDVTKKTPQCLFDSLTFCGLNLDLGLVLSCTCRPSPATFQIPPDAHGTLVSTSAFFFFSGAPEDYLQLQQPQLQACFFCSSDSTCKLQNSNSDHLSRSCLVYVFFCVVYFAIDFSKISTKKRSAPMRTEP